MGEAVDTIPLVGEDALLFSLLVGFIVALFTCHVDHSIEGVSKGQNIFLFFAVQLNYYGVVRSRLILQRMLQIL